MADKADVFEIDLGGFTSSSEDEEEKKVDIASSSPQSRSSRSNAAKSLANGGVVNNKETPTASMSEEQAKHDFESKYFSAEKFVEKKVSDMTVSELVNYSNELNHGVKALDSEMQMMVYDNYNKFISATDTIRKMKDQVENMENEMSKLLSNISNIANSCSEIENKFAPNRCEIEKLVSVRGLLKKLEFLFELPNRLKKNIELGDFERAVEYFQMAHKILIKYRDIESFHRISIESQEIINDLRCNLKKELISKHISSSKQLQIAKLLLSLNEEAELLWYDIFSTRKDALLSTIITLKNSPQLLQYYENKDENKTFFSVIDYFRVHFVSLFTQFVEEYKCVFLDKSSFSDREKEKSRAALTSFTRDIFCEYFNVMKLELQKELNIDKLTEELELFYDNLYKPSKCVPSAKLQDRGTEIIEHCIRRSMEREFKETRHSQWRHLIAYMRNITNNEAQYENHIKKCVTSCKLLAIECLNRLVPLTTNQSQLISILDLNFDDQLWSYTANIFKMFVDIIPIEVQRTHNIYNNDAEEDCELQFNAQILAELKEELDAFKLLLLSKILIGIKANAVHEIIKHFKKNYLYGDTRSGSNSSNTQLGIYKQEVLLFKKYCQECASGLRLMYAERCAMNMIEIVIIVNDEEFKTRIAEEMNECIQNMKEIYHINEQLISCHVIQNTFSRNKSSDREYDKLFNEQSLIYDVVNDNANSVLFTIFKIVFKYWSETLRTQIIKTTKRTREIHQKVEFFRHHIPKIISKKDFKKLQTLLDEIQQSTTERASANIVDTIDTIDID